MTNEQLDSEIAMASAAIACSEALAKLAVTLPSDAIEKLQEAMASARGLAFEFRVYRSTHSVFELSVPTRLGRRVIASCSGRSDELGTTP